MLKNQGVASAYVGTPLDAFEKRVRDARETYRVPARKSRISFTSNDLFAAVLAFTAVAYGAKKITEPLRQPGTGNWILTSTLRYQGSSHDGCTDKYVEVRPSMLVRTRPRNQLTRTCTRAGQEPYVTVMIDSTNPTTLDWVHDNTSIMDRDSLDQVIIKEAARTKTLDRSSRGTIMVGGVPYDAHEYFLEANKHYVRVREHAVKLFRQRNTRQYGPARYKRITAF